MRPGPPCASATIRLRRSDAVSGSVVWVTIRHRVSVAVRAIPTSATAAPVPIMASGSCTNAARTNIPASRRGDRRDRRRGQQREGEQRDDLEHRGVVAREPCLRVVGGRGLVDLRRQLTEQPRRSVGDPGGDGVQHGAGRIAHQTARRTADRGERVGHGERNEQTGGCRLPGAWRRGGGPDARADTTTAAATASTANARPAHRLT